MSKPKSEGELLKTILDKVQPRHPILTFTVPTSGSFITEGHVVPSPDVIIENPATQRTIVIEVKGGSSVESVPYATVPQMRSLQAAFNFKNSKIMLISASEVPNFVKSALEKDHIEVIEADSVEKAVERLEEAISKLEETQERD